MINAETTSGISSRRNLTCGIHLLDTLQEERTIAKAKEKQNKAIKNKRKKGNTQPSKPANTYFPCFCNIDIFTLAVVLEVY